MAFQSPIQFQFAVSDTVEYSWPGQGVRYIRVVSAPFPFSIYLGPGKSSRIAQIGEGDQRTIQLPESTDSLTFYCPVLPAIPDALYNIVEVIVSANLQVDAGHGAAPVRLARFDTFGQARGFEPWGSGASLTQTAESSGLVWIAGGSPSDRKSTTFDVMARPAAGPYLGAYAIAAGVREAAASLYTPLSAIEVSGIDIAIASSTAAAEISADVARLSASPTGGVSITPAARSGDLTFVVARYHPAVFAEVAGSVMGWSAWRLGITGASPTAAPPPPISWVPMIGGDSRDTPIRVDAGTGLAVVLESDTNTTVRVGVRMTFREVL